MATFVDISEFLSAPHRTGIQRVCGELMRLWPEHDELVPVKVSAQSRLVELRAGTRSIIRSFFEANLETLPAVRAEITRLSSEEGPEVNLSSHPLLIPELFYDQPRTEFYRSLDERQLENVRFMVFDMLPLTHPQFFAAATPFHIICRYFRILRRAPRLAFISETTRRTYYDRLQRKWGSGPVLRLGSDGLGEKFIDPGQNPKPLYFSMIGTIEPRKQHSLVLDAFASLFSSLPGLSLTIVGRMECADPSTARQVHAARKEMPMRFRLFENAGDAVIRDVLAHSRATLFLSAAEGFGLPPVESLFYGVPVIASRDVPSLEAIGDRGVRLVDRDIESVRRAVLDFCNDEYYAAKCEEARSLRLPTWGSFCEEAHAWVHDLNSQTELGIQ